ncbi:transglycosylase SLT domain-containing protein [Salinisphaera hydrothermalis]|uniref:Lytic murein transglycosylase F n=1 Tax=Salinisphaera hydrothermalis (strain C41B8) TaxID=1304275 RepID=A0A084IKL9_SALHC|nr:transglycosylase SLT domain-containing protein [Salinisphaera hydrothermalis]KEZ77253.1 lytic murein transglycosylase F [Salinisphaera hydrothermalis C41B8]
MTPFRVVAPAAGMLLIGGCLSTMVSAAPTALAPARLDGLGHHLFPDTGRLLRPDAARWPIFIDPVRHRTTRGFSLAGFETIAPTASNPSTPHLTTRQQRDLRHRLATTLPRYQRLFTHVGQNYGLPAALIAAVAYTESKWRPRARHHDVAGMMMLSSSTAHTVGVSDRLSAAENVSGGARYLAKMRALISHAVPLPDRNYFALAAYNMGIGHLRDAQTLARRLGKNPHLWADLKQVIPLLAERRYYAGLDHGYARGDAVVAYIERVRGCERLIAPHLD